MIYRLKHDVVSVKRKPATKKSKDDFVYYARAGTFAKIISNHDKVVICESLTRLSKKKRDDKDEFKANGNKFSTKRDNLIEWN